MIKKQTNKQTKYIFCKAFCCMEQVSYSLLPSQLPARYATKLVSLLKSFDFLYEKLIPNQIVMFP